MIFSAVLLALRQISRNYLRAFLTMLGIIIGVASVVIMITLGNGTTQQITKEITNLGSNVLLIFPARGINASGVSLRKKFTLQEADAVRDRIQGLQAVAPVASGSVVMRHLQKNTQTRAYGITPDYFIAGNWNLAEGRTFNEKDYRAGTNVCILGESVRLALFKDDSPLGTHVKINGIVCEAVGVLQGKGQGMGSDQDDLVLLPQKTYKRSISASNSLNNIDNIMVSMEEDVDSQKIAEQIKTLLREMRNITSGDRESFEIMDTKEIQETLSKTIGTMTLFLGAIAGVSLLVGGIGIMNIMLVSVTERTKEIGTRLAIGALEKEVLLQFLIEAITISSIGGLIGIVFSFFASLGISQLMSIPFAYDLKTALWAFLFSSFIGVLFGYLPAKRASKLNPIDALRHE